MTFSRSCHKFSFAFSKTFTKFHRNEEPLSVEVQAVENPRRRFRSERSFLGQLFPAHCCSTLLFPAHCWWTTASAAHSLVHNPIVLLLDLVLHLHNDSVFLLDLLLRLHNPSVFYSTLLLDLLLRLYNPSVIYFSSWIACSTFAMPVSSSWTLFPTSTVSVSSLWISYSTSTMPVSSSWISASQQWPSSMPWSLEPKYHLPRLLDHEACLCWCLLWWTSMEFIPVRKKVNILQKFPQLFICPFLLSQTSRPN